MVGNVKTVVVHLAATSVDNARRDEDQEIALGRLLGMAAEEAPEERNVAQERNLVVHRLALLGDKTAHDDRRARIHAYLRVDRADVEERLFHRCVVVGDALVGARDVFEHGGDRIPVARDNMLHDGSGRRVALVCERTVASCDVELACRGVSGERNPHAVVLPRRLVDDLRVELEVNDVAVVGQGRGDLENHADFAHREALGLDNGENRALAAAAAIAAAAGRARLELDVVVGRVDVLGDDLHDGLLAGTRKHFGRRQEVGVAALREHVENHGKVCVAKEGVQLDELIVVGIVLPRDVVVERREVTLPR